MLKGQSAIVTGSGRGVGRAVALMLAEHGAKVVISDRDSAPAEEVVAEIKANGGEAIVFVGDVTASDFAEEIMKKTAETFGGVNILVNNAGYTWDSLVHKMTDEQFQAMLDIHLIAPFRLIRAATPYMVGMAKQEIANGIITHRKIVNVSSVAGVMGNVGQANYSSAKAGVIGLTKTMAREWGAFNINCNAVAFGLIDTRLTRSKEHGESIGEVALGIPEKIRTMFEQMTPQKRAGLPEEAAAGIFYLASPLSNYVNGQVLNINGGFYT